MSQLQSTSNKHRREDDVEAGSRAQAKKARSDETELVRDGEFWYEDGSIILVARTVQFRVYKGVLADLSPVFADMFSLPQPTSSLPAAPADCPLVHLDDSPEDLRHILRALFPKKDTAFVQDEPSRRAYHTISAYIRLGHKYQVDTLFNQSLSYLKNCYTTDFEARQAWLKTNDGAQVPFEWGRYYDSQVYSIGVVNIARLVQCDTILPTALAACCSLEVERLFDGFVREDGTRERLSEADLKLCLAGMRGLTLAVSAVVLKALASPSRRECKTKAACRREIQEILCDVAQEDSPIYFLTDNPFRDIDRWITSDVSWEEEKACAGCLAEVKKRFRTEQQNMWAALPSILNIIVEGWPQSDECA
ncbi:hypothetical protein K466DRAFT_521356 [Polyporus arcularius HHB13444]|uniref:BTB domain-containing protein n=1 Tax=Polyporus arcularius HHB13444 TaxID=1314778 RepID=A0A5C3PGF2_9APHY|nr:hypothetical protein K466DRAFT_521356 [Polyporus arcularius HHB13444]